MVASIRAAHPYYFLPSLDEEPVSRPCVTQPSRNGKLKNGHGRVLAAIADDDPMR
jgi:hypothetical protein